MDELERGVFQKAIHDIMESSINNGGIVTIRSIANYCRTLRKNQFDTNLVCVGQNGCLWKNVEIYSDGIKTKIKDARQTIMTKSATEDGKIVDAFAYKMKTGRQKLYKIKFKSGKEIIATSEHRWMSESGWMKTNELKDGTRIKTIDDLR